MKAFKFIFIVVLISLIFFGIPFSVYTIGRNNTYFTTVEGTNLKGPIGYYGLIIEDENATTELKTKAANLFLEFTSIIKDKNKDTYNLFFTTFSLISILIIIIGVILRTTTKPKLYSNAVITSGFIIFILYFAVYFFDYLILL